MLQDQFINRLLLIVVFGAIYIYTMMKMASCNSGRNMSNSGDVLVDASGISRADYRHLI